MVIHLGTFTSLLCLSTWGHRPQAGRALGRAGVRVRALDAQGPWCEGQSWDAPGPPHVGVRACEAPGPQCASQSSGSPRAPV